MSPGLMPGFSTRCSSVHFTDSEWLLEKYCRFGPMKTASPVSVSSEACRSRQSITICETDSRCSSSECSRLTFISEYRITS